MTLHLRKQLARGLRNIALEVRDEPFTLKSGALSRHYVDCRKLLLDPTGRNLAGRYGAALILAQKQEIDALAGAPLGGLLFAETIATVLDAPLVVPRLDPKDHGKENQADLTIDIIEMLHRSRSLQTPDTRAPRIFLVEDVITTGSTVERAGRILIEQGFAIAGVLALVLRRPWNSPWPLLACFTLDELVDYEPSNSTT